LEIKFNRPLIFEITWDEGKHRRLERGKCEKCRQEFEL
jgi:hypothetical protein